MYILLLNKQTSLLNIMLLLLDSSVLFSLGKWIVENINGIINHISFTIKFCQWLTTGQWFSPGTPVSSTNKTDHNDITEVLLKVVLNTINKTYN